MVLTNLVTCQVLSRNRLQRILFQDTTQIVVAGLSHQAMLGHCLTLMMGHFLKVMMGHCLTVMMGHCLTRLPQHQEVQRLRGIRLMI